jgi:hypothetical protein
VPILTRNKCTETVFLKFIQIFFSFSWNVYIYDISFNKFKFISNISKFLKFAVSLFSRSARDYETSKTTWGIVSHRQTTDFHTRIRAIGVAGCSSAPPTIVLHNQRKLVLLSTSNNCLAQPEETGLARHLQQLSCTTRKTGLAQHIQQLSCTTRGNRSCSAPPTIVLHNQRKLVVQPVCASGHILEVWPPPQEANCTSKRWCWSAWDIRWLLPEPITIGTLAPSRWNRMAPPPIGKSIWDQMEFLLQGPVLPPMGPAVVSYHTQM